MQVSAKVVPRISLPEDDIWQGGQNLATETDPRDYFWQPNLVLGTIYSNQNWSPRTTFGWDQFAMTGPGTCLPFLGIVIDLVAQELWLPQDKLLRRRDALSMSSSPWRDNYNTQHQSHR